MKAGGECRREGGKKTSRQRGSSKEGGGKGRNQNSQRPRTQDIELGKGWEKEASPTKKHKENKIISRRVYTGVQGVVWGDSSRIVPTCARPTPIKTKKYRKNALLHGSQLWIQWGHSATLEGKDRRRKALRTSRGFTKKSGGKHSPFSKGSRSDYGKTSKGPCWVGESATANRATLEKKT